MLLRRVSSIRAVAAAVKQRRDSPSTRQQNPRLVGIAKFVCATIPEIATFILVGD